MTQTSKDHRPGCRCLSCPGMPPASETQTSKAPSLGVLLHQANELHIAITAALEAVQNDDGPIQPMEWHELAAAAGACSLTASLIEHIIRRQAAADQPIPYTPAPVMAYCSKDMAIVHPVGQCPYQAGQ